MNTSINMIPGTAKQIAGVAIARMSKGKIEVRHAVRALKLAERSAMVRMTMLANATSFAYPVVVPFDQIVVTTMVGQGGNVGVVEASARLSQKLADMLDANADQGPYELWFDDAGEAWVSFAEEGDAVLFRLSSGV